MNIYGNNVSPCRTPVTISKKYVSPCGEANIYLCVFIEHHYGCDCFFRETIGKKYLLHFLSVYRVKCFGEINK